MAPRETMGGVRGSTTRSTPSRNCGSSSCRDRPPEPIRSTYGAIPDTCATGASPRTKAIRPTGAWFHRAGQRDPGGIARAPSALARSSPRTACGCRSRGSADAGADRTHNTGTELRFRTSTTTDNERSGKAATTTRSIADVATASVSASAVSSTQAPRRTASRPLWRRRATPPARATSRLASAEHADATASKAEAASGPPHSRRPGTRRSRRSWRRWRPGVPCRRELVGRGGERGQVASAGVPSTGIVRSPGMSPAASASANTRRTIRPAQPQRGSA